MKKWKPVISWVLTIVWVSGLLPGGLTAYAAGTEPVTDDIVIVYTNDVHNEVEHIKNSTNGLTNIGYAGVAAYKKDMEILVGEDNVTLVDAGDAMQGDAIGTMSRGEYITEIMNQVGYDVFVPGNHEFDYGMDRMKELMGMLEAQVVSSNFISTTSSATVFNPYTIIAYNEGTVDEKKVAFVGITTPESFTKSTPAYFQNDKGEFIYGFLEGNYGQDLYNGVQGAVDKARAEGADYVIAVGHLGIDVQSAPWRSTDVIAHTRGIDAFIDGHSHSVVACQTIKNMNNKDVILTQTGTKLANIGRMIIKPDGIISTELISGYDKLDTDTDNFIKDIKSEFAADLAEKVGNTKVALTVNDPATGKRMVRSRETNLGDLATDAYRYVLGNGKTGIEAGPADIAFVNGGGVRDNIDAGDITFGEVIKVHPFNNVGCVVEATGLEVINALEMAARMAPAENGGFLQVSGLTYTIDTSVPSTVVVDDKSMFVKVSGARRVKNVMVGGQPIDVIKTYTLASHNYMLLNGGDGINMFSDNKVVVQPVILDNQILISYIQDYLNGTVGEKYSNPYGQGRIKEASLNIKQIARYSSDEKDAEGGVQEIITYNPVNKFSYSVSGKSGVLTSINMSGMKDSSTVTPVTGSNIDVKELVNVDGFTYGDITSAAVSPDGMKLAVAIQAEDYEQPGCIVIFNCNANGSLTYINSFETGVQPDMVVFADNNTILTADEGEPREGYTTTPGAIDPKGSVTIINLTADFVTGSAIVVDFNDFDTSRAELVASGVILKKDTAPSVDLEPEYIAVVDNKAYVTLQEANSVAVLDLDSKEFTGVYSLGVQDYSKTKIDIDNSSEVDGGAYTPRNYADTFGLRMPDGIAAYQVNGKIYILTANEGDSREWGDDNLGTDYLNEVEKKLTAIDGTVTSKKVRMLSKDYEGQPGLADGSKNYLFGGRSFSVFETTGSALTLVYDSGADFESKTAEFLPDYFNSSNDNVDRDSRSNKKGPEPESVTIGTVNGRTYAFVTLERIGGIMAYDITAPNKITFASYINSRDFVNVDEDGIGNDDSPEGLKFIPATESPVSGNALLLVAYEVSGNIGAYTVNPIAPDNASNPSTSNPSTGTGTSATQNTTETVTNPDGSKTTTVTDAVTGTITATTTGNDGSKIVVEKKKDGTVITTDTRVNGVKSETITTPDGKTTSKITLPDNVTNTVVNIPVSNADAGTVAVIVKADGTEEIIRGSVADDGKLLIPLSDSANIKVIYNNGKSFSDTQNHWAHEAIEFATARGLFTGTSTSSFSPDMPMTRGMMVTVLHKFANSPKIEGKLFDDVSREAYYADAVAWATQNKIVAGKGKGFAPNSNITREQIAVILYNYAAPTSTEGNLTKFRDSSEVSSWATEAMTWAVGYGLFLGDNNGNLNPTRDASRAEVASILQNFITNLVH